MYSSIISYEEIENIDSNKPAAGVSLDFSRRVYLLIVIYPFSFVFNCLAWRSAMKPPCCMKRFDRTVVMEYHSLMHHLSSFKIPGSAGISVPIWGLRNLLNDPRVRIDKVKVATVFSTLFPTLCLFPQCPRSCRAAARSSVRRCGIRMQSVHFLAGNLQVEKEKLIPQ